MREVLGRGRKSTIKADVSPKAGATWRNGQEAEQASTQTSARGKRAAEAPPLLGTRQALVRRGVALRTEAREIAGRAGPDRLGQPPLEREQRGAAGHSPAESPQRALHLRQLGLPEALRGRAPAAPASQQGQGGGRNAEGGQRAPRHGPEDRPPGRRLGQ